MNKNIVILLLCVIIIILGINNYHLRDDKVACSATLVNMASEYPKTHSEPTSEDWLNEIQQLRNRVLELERANKLLTQWVGQLGVEARRIGVHVTINGLDYAAILRRLNKEMENKNDNS